MELTKGNVNRKDCKNRKVCKYLGGKKKWFSLIGVQKYSINARNKSNNVIPGNLHPRGECYLRNHHQKQILN